MKQTSPASPRALVLLAATALCSTPLVAQETPPPVAATLPQAVTPPVPAPMAAPAPVLAPRQEVVQPLPVRAAPVPDSVAEDEPSPRATRRASVTERRGASPAKVPTVAPATVASTAVETVPAPTPPVVATEALPPQESTATATPVVEKTTSDNSSSIWLWIIGGVVAALAAFGLILSSRRRRFATYADEPVYATDIGAVPMAPVAMPVAEPVVGVPNSFAERPWIRMTLEPTSTVVRGDDSLMTYQLIVENEGPVDAHDVQISSFLPREGRSSPVEDALIDPKALRGRVDVAAGRSVRVEASVVVPLAGTDGHEAKIVADARYPLPDGGEGHLAACFAVDTASDEMTTRVDDVLERV